LVMTFYWPWWHLVKTFWWPRWPWWRSCDDPCYDLWLPCDELSWLHWWPLRWQWRPLMILSKVVILSCLVYYRGGTNNCWISRYVLGKVLLEHHRLHGSPMCSCWSQSSCPLVLKNAVGSCMQCFSTQQHLIYGSYYDDKDDHVITRMAN
jgi:hypothetical protein